MSKVIIIDSATRTVRFDDLDLMKGDAIRDAIGGWIEIAFKFPWGDVLYVDEEGLLKPSEHFFRFALRADPMPLAGIGVIVGREVYDRDGELLEVANTLILVERLRPLITWLTRAQAEAWAKGNASEPSSTITYLDADGVPHTEVTTRVGQLFSNMPRKEQGS